MGRVYRKQTIEGVTVPAIIHNSQYFWHNMAVYEDGTISCWNKVDLFDVPDEISRGWLAYKIPDGKSISVYGACCFELADGRWEFDNGSYFNFIKETVRSMNPEFANIYKTTERERGKWNDLRIKFTASPTFCKLQQSTFSYEHISGDDTNVFLNADGVLRLTALYAYADGTFSVDGIDGRSFTFEEIEGLFGDKTLRVAPKDGDIISFGALGTARCTHCFSKTKLKEKLKEIENMSLKVQKKPDAHDRCIRAYHEYLVEPTDFYRERLREAYEAVPEHERCFLGDMDSKDSDFRRILYSDEKREV